MMTDPAELQQLQAHLSSAVILGADLPKQIFRPGYGQFRFIEHGCTWKLLRYLLRDSLDQSVLVLVTDPNFFSHCGHFGVYEFTAAASDQDWGLIY
ncbi:MAG: hypothetical protein ABI824_17970 [Acidobacteriota bacterium]